MPTHLAKILSKRTNTWVNPLSIGIMDQCSREFRLVRSMLNAVTSSKTPCLSADEVADIGIQRTRLDLQEDGNTNQPHFFAPGHFQQIFEALRDFSMETLSPYESGTGAMSHNIVYDLCDSVSSCIPWELAPAGIAYAWRERVTHQSRLKHSLF